jgi:hypothetical protein
MFKELIEFALHNKKWWLLPLLFIFIIFGVLILITTSSPVNPFIYMFF